MSGLRDSINAELDKIRKKHGGTLKQQHVVDFARNPNTALHSQFEWDDTKAAEQHRLKQAERVIQLYVIKVTDDQKSPVRALVSLVDDRKPGSGLPGYRALSDVMKDETLRDSLLQTALMELRAFRRKYDHLKELSDVWIAAEKVEQRQIRKARKEERATA